MIGHVLAPVAAFLRKSADLRFRGSRVRIPAPPDDFGSDAAKDITREGAILGTLSYMVRRGIQLAFRTVESGGKAMVMLEHQPPGEHLPR